MIRESRDHQFANIAVCLKSLRAMSAGSAVVFAQPMNHMGVIGIASATIATLWNFVFNMGFDRAMLYSRGSVQKTVAIRVAHTFLFEAGLVVMLIPMIAWYLGIGLWAALLMDLAIVTFYLIYGFLFKIAGRELASKIASMSFTKMRRELLFRELFGARPARVALPYATEIIRRNGLTRSRRFIACGVRAKENTHIITSEKIFSSRVKPVRQAEKLHCLSGCRPKLDFL